jgi:hypothetical protein
MTDSERIKRLENTIAELISIIQNIELVGGGEYPPYVTWNWKDSLTQLYKKLSE